MLAYIPTAKIVFITLFIYLFLYLFIKIDEERRGRSVDEGKREEETQERDCRKW